MSARNIFYFFTFIVTLLTLTSCGNDDELAYPVTYTYDNIKFEDSWLFKFNETGHEEIEFTERLSAIEPILRESITFENSGFPFNQITLLSEDQILFKSTAQPSDSLSMEYRQMSSTWFQIFFNGSGGDILNLFLFESNTQIWYCIQSSAFFRQANTGNNGSLDY